MNEAGSERTTARMDVARPAGRRRAFLVNAALIVLSLLLALAMLEGGLRLAGIGYPRLYGFDYDLGGSHVPGARGWWTKEGHAWVEINSDGMRDHERPVKKPPGEFRIAVLGDSYAAAFEVDAADAFWSVMERRLESCPALAGRSVDALNFGVSGYGTARELQMLRHRVWKYEPDLVLLAFLTGNDIRNNSYDLEHDPTAVYFVMGDNGLQLHPAFLQTREHRKRRAERADLGDKISDFLHPRLRVFQVYDQARRQLKAWWRADVPAPPPGNEPGLDDQVYAPPKDAKWEDAWGMTETLVRTMAGEVREHRAEFVVATLSNGIQVDPDPAARKALAAQMGVPDLLYPDRRVMDWATELGVPHVMLAPSLRQWAEEHQTCVHGFANATPCGGHWNEHGHEIAGKEIANLVCDVVAQSSR